MARVKNVSAAAVALSAVLALSAWPPAVEQAAAAQTPGLQIVVLEGEGGENIIARGAEIPTLVEVRDGSDQPVSGASVRFLLREGDPATLNAELREVTLTTNALGQAAVMVNPVATGAVELSVTATLAGETATATIMQENFATDADAAARLVPTGVAEPGAAAGAPDGGIAIGAPASGGGLGAGAIAGLAGAGAAVGVSLAVAGGGDSTPSEPPVLPEPPARPPPPSLMAGDRQLAVSWSAPAANGAAIIEYDVQYRSSGGTWSELPGGQFLDRRATIPALTNGTRYEVQVRAGNSVGKGEWSDSATRYARLRAVEAGASDVDAGRRAVDGELERTGGQRVGDRRVRRAVSALGRGELVGAPRRPVPRPAGDNPGVDERDYVRGSSAGGELRGQGGVVCERDGHPGLIAVGASNADVEGG